jgi:hypothetical protein
LVGVVRGDARQTGFAIRDVVTAVVLVVDIAPVAVGENVVRDIVLFDHFIFPRIECLRQLREFLLGCLNHGLLPGIVLVHEVILSGIVVEPDVLRPLPPFGPAR